VVTKPFQFEGQRRMKVAESAIHELQKVAKHFDITITDDELVIERRSQPIEAGCRTPAPTMNYPETEGSNLALEDGNRVP